MRSPARMHRWLSYCALMALLSVAALLLFAHTPVMAQEGQGSSTDGVVFYWAFGAVTGSGEARKLEPIKQDIELKSGDELKLLIQLQKKCFVYVFHSNERNELQMLFPYSLQQFATDYDTGRNFYIPQGESWLKLDEQSGTEAVHLIAADQRIQSLENLWSQYEGASSEHKPHIAKEFLEEIRNLKKQHRNLASRAERPVAIGGAVRGIIRAQNANPFDVAAIANEISAADFYAKTYTIEHK